MQANHVVAISRLMHALWPVDSAPASARKILQNAVWGLRRVLGQDDANLVTQAPGYMLQVDLDSVDLYRFQRLVAEGGARLAAGAPEAAARLLRESLALWRGPALADLIEAGVTWPELTALQTARLDALETYFDAQLACGQHQAVLADLKALVESEPLRERACGQLMVALYRCGRQADALTAYARIRTALVEDLGLEPGRDLQLLQRCILTHDPSLMSGRYLADQAPEGAARPQVVRPLTLVADRREAPPVAGRPTDRMPRPVAPAVTLPVSVGPVTPLVSVGPLAAIPPTSADRPAGSAPAVPPAGLPPAVPPPARTAPLVSIGVRQQLTVPVPAQRPGPGSVPTGSVIPAAESSATGPAAATAAVPATAAVSATSNAPPANGLAPVLSGVAAAGSRGAQPPGTTGLSTSPPPGPVPLPGPVVQVEPASPGVVAPFSGPVPPLGSYVPPPAAAPAPPVVSLPPVCPLSTPASGDREPHGPARAVDDRPAGSRDTREQPRPRAGDASTRPRPPREPADDRPPPRTAPGAERREVTALLVQVDLGADLDDAEPDVIDEAIEAASTVIRDTVESFDGVVAASIGLVSLALFGAGPAGDSAGPARDGGPSRTVDPERAVRAALAIRAAAGGAGQHTPATVRAAVGTGEAVVRYRSAGSTGTPTITGPLLDGSQALLAEVPTGEIWVCDTTYEATRSFVGYQRVDGAHGWQVRAGRRTYLGPRALPIVDREYELEVLRGLLERTCHRDRPHLVTVLGEPGVGKTRFVMEFERRIAGQPAAARFVVGRVPSSTEGRAVRLQAELLRALCAVVEADPAATVRAKLGRVLRRATPADVPGRLSRMGRPMDSTVDCADDSDPAPALAAIRVMLAEAATVCPLVVVIDDVHHADDALLDFIDGLAETVGSVPLLVIAAARTHLLQQRPGWGGGKRHATTITLDPLSDAAIDRVLEFLAPGAQHEVKDPAGRFRLQPEIVA